ALSPATIRLLWQAALAISVDSALVHREDTGAGGVTQVANARPSAEGAYRHRPRCPRSRRSAPYLDSPVAIVARGLWSWAATNRSGHRGSQDWSGTARLPSCEARPCQQG